jgi:uncharacterized iron-regulated protein
MMRFLLFFYLLLKITCFGQSDPSYTVFSGTGKKKSFEKLLKESAKADFTFFGELHNEITAHELECQLLNYLYSIHEKKLLLGAEMFESDNQQGIDAYLNGEISADSLKNVVRLWPNHADYQPLLTRAKDEKLPFIATNIPRKYASLVFKQGLDSLMKLDSSHLNFICPLPFEMDTTLKSYKDLLTFGAHGSTNFMMAQAIKDATMAYFIYNFSFEGSKFLHFNGSYHSNFDEGIVWHLKNYFPKKEYLTIAVVSQESSKKLSKENKKLADFIIVLPTNSPKSYED